jgi:hypothetical protein
MQKKVLVVLMVLGLGCAWSSLGLAADVGYRFKDDKITLQRVPGPPSSTLMGFDALVARPLGAAATVIGTTLFVATIPMTASTASTSEAAWGLVGRPYNYTFNRPLGRGVPQFEEEGVFKP